LAGIEDVQSLLMEDFLRECLAGALKNSELPAKTNIADTLVSLMTIMVGTMIAVKFNDIRNIKYQYQRQLQMLWKESGAGKHKGT